MRRLARFAMVAVLALPGSALAQPTAKPPARAGSAALVSTAEPRTPQTQSSTAPAIPARTAAVPAQARPQDMSRLSATQLEEDEELVALIDVHQGKEAFGQIVVRLHHKYAPAHVENFVKLAAEGFYDGTLFHRVSPENFIQGGDPLSRDADPRNDGRGGPGYDLVAEINAKENVRGAVAAATTGGRDSGSQFFICLRDHPEWNERHTVLGNVMDGMQIADRIGHAPRKGDRPVDPVAIKVTIEKRKRQLKFY